MNRAAVPLLDEINVPADLRRFAKTGLAQIATELRAETLNAVSVTGGHLGTGMGVMELTVALHYVFDTPGDRLIWDVGPIEGHDLDQLTVALEAVRDGEPGPVLLHILTEMGRDYESAAASADKLHAVGRVDVKTGVQDHDDQQRQYEEADLNASTLVRIIESSLICTA